MKRALALAMLVAALAVLAEAIAHRSAEATLDDDVFTSREADVRMVAPRGWRVSDTPSYPGVLLWMNRSKPPGQMLLTVEDISAASRACWPKECGHDATVPDFVCVLSSRLHGAGFTVGPIEDGRWFDYQLGKDAKRFLRQGVVVLGHHAFTLILAAPTAGDRATHAREFDRALRSLRPLSSAGPEGGAAGAPAEGAGATDDATLSPGAPAPGETTDAAGADVQSGASPRASARGRADARAGTAAGGRAGAATATPRDAPIVVDAAPPITSVPPGPATDATPATLPAIDAAPPLPDAGVPVV